MKKILLIITSISMFASLKGYSATHTCYCNIDKIYAGFVGGTGNSSKSKIECTNGKSYFLGVVDTDLVKIRHSMALAAKMANKQVVLQYWSSDGSKSCDVASSNTTIFPDGMYVE